jgi:hypothetical protein
MSVLRFQTNVPVEVALAYRDGKEAEGNYGPQVMFSLKSAPNGETTMYLPPICAERIRELGIEPGQRISVTKAEVKAGNRRGIEWKVSRVDPDPRWQDEAGRPEPSRRETVTKPAAPVMDNTDSTPSSGNGKVNGKPNGSGNGHNGAGNGHAVANGVPYWDPKAELLRCYLDAIDVLVAARDAAATKSLPVQFTGEDLRQAAAVLYIDAGKNVRTRFIGDRQ